MGAIAALAAVGTIALLPGLVDVGFLGQPAMPVGLLLLLHVPVAVAVLAVTLGVLLITNAVRRWWTPRTTARDAALVVALTALAAQLSLWNMVGWGF